MTSRQPTFLTYSCMTNTFLNELVCACCVNETHRGGCKRRPTAGSWRESSRPPHVDSACWLFGTEAGWTVPPWSLMQCTLWTNMNKNKHTDRWLHKDPNTTCCSHVSCVRWCGLYRCATCDRTGLLGTLVTLHCPLVVRYMKNTDDNKIVLQLSKLNYSMKYIGKSEVCFSANIK